MIAAYPKDKDGNKLVSVPYYRVGDLFLTTIATNPSNFLGGTWELFGPGRCLVCVDTSQTEFNSVKKTGGEKSHILTVNEMPSHNHNILRSDGGNASDLGWGSNQWDTGLISTSGTNKKNVYQQITNTGGSQAHNNLQPFITCYVWIRTA